MHVSEYMDAIYPSKFYAINFFDEKIVYFMNNSIKIRLHTTN